MAKILIVLDDSLKNSWQGKPELADLMLYLESIDSVVVIGNTEDDVINDKQRLTEFLKRESISKVILTGFEPGKLKSYFSLIFKEVGLDPGAVAVLNFSENNILTPDDLEIARSLLYSEIMGFSLEETSALGENEVKPVSLVIGGGIAGIQSALEIANAGQKVILVEKTGTIGGHMAMFDKTFPTLDCAACILTPKMVEVGQNPNIELLTYSEVTGIEGKPGDYQVKILKKARKVDISSCIGCGTCAEKCPATALSEFDANTTLRKAIYIPFPQAVPNKYLIDEKSCTYLEDPYKILGATIKKCVNDGLPENVASKLDALKNVNIGSEETFMQLLKKSLGEEDANKYASTIRAHTGKCKVCVATCPVENCIDLDQKDETIDVTVGNIIVATGFKTFDPSVLEQFGYGQYLNVLTSIEFERLLNAAGPTGGNITFRTVDKKGNKIFLPGSGTPGSFALIHCVGSRDENHNSYCSRVCCMYSLKMAHLIKEKVPDADVFEYFIDMRAFGKGYEEFYERIKNEGVHMIRGKTAKIEQVNGHLVLRSEDILNQKLIEQEVDMVVLSVGLQPAEDASQIARMTGIAQDESGWFREAHYNLDATGTIKSGIGIAGVCQGPKDIPDSVAQASAAASRVLQRIIKGKVKGNPEEIMLETVKTKVEELLK